MTKKIALVGLGNAGGNVVKLYGQKYPETADRIIINTSSTDMSKFNPMDFEYSIRMGDLDGTGGNHDVAKTVAMNLMNDKILKDEKFISLLTDKDYVFVIGSSAGGTGSGMLPVIYQVISKYMNVAEKVIAVCILPEEGLTVDRLDNALLNQSELYTDPEATYMVYDNSRFDIKSSFELKEKVNQEIVDDLAVFTGLDLLPSEYNNIDAEDMLSLMSVPGRIVIVRCASRSIDHTDIEARILSDLENRSAHAILNNDKIVGAYGLIANLSKDSIEGLDESLPMIRDKIGEPVSTYMNLSDKSDNGSKVIFIMTGLAKPNARLFEIHELLTSKSSKIKQDETEFSYRDMTITSKRRSRFSAKTEDVKLDDIFNKLK